MDIIKNLFKTKTKKQTKKKTKRRKNNTKKKIKTYNTYDILDNNIDYFIFQNNSVNTVNLILNINAGSGNEIENYKGISHYIEHMLFRGNEKYVSQKMIVNKLAKLNGKINGSTSKVNTYYYITIPGKHINTGLSILYNMLFNSFFTCRDILLEKKIVNLEKNKNVDNPVTYSYKLAISNHFKNTNYEHFINGPNAKVNTFNRGDILAFLKSNYIFDNISLSVHGNIPNVKELKKNINKLFNKEELNNELYTPLEGSEEEISYNQCYPKLIQHNKKYKNKIIKHTSDIFYTINTSLNTAFINIIYNVNTKFKNQDLFIEILKNLLIKGMNSILFDKLRLKKGLFYSIKCEYEVLNNNKIFIISYQTNNDLIEKSINEYLKCINQLKSDIINKETLKTIKTIITNNINNNMFSNTRMENSIQIHHKLINIPTQNRKQFIKNGIFYELEFNHKNLQDFYNEVFTKQNMSISIYAANKKKLNIIY